MEIGSGKKERPEIYYYNATIQLLCMHMYMRLLYIVLRQSLYKFKVYISFLYAKQKNV